MATSLEDRIIGMLPGDGSNRGNVAIIRSLGCSEDKYNIAKEKLVESGKISIGRGYGGSIRLNGSTLISKTSKMILDYIKANAPDGVAIGNKQIKSAFSLSDDVYWDARNVLLENGDIGKGGGKGGSVYLILKDKETERRQRLPRKAYSSAVKEEYLMLPLADTLSANWARFMDCGENSMVLDTSRQGRNATGAWSRPDFVACAYREYKFSARTLELTSFEVKPFDGIDERCVYEALSHKKNMHYSYLLLHFPDFDDSKDKVYEEIYRESHKYGIGIIYFSDPYDFDNWEFALDPVRNTPPPENIETFFLRQAIDQEKLETISGWLKE